MESTAEPFEDMYVCDVCNRTYHWSCLLSLGCYKDEDRESVKNDDKWACPACACLTDPEKESRHHFAENEELQMVTWEPTWEPKDLANSHPDFGQKIQEYLRDKQPDPNLSSPAADTSLDNLTRQGFSKDDISDNPWQQKSDYILRNKVTFDFHTTNPELDIQPTGHCKYWVHEVCLMDHTDHVAQPHEQEP